MSIMGCLSRLLSQKKITKAQHDDAKAIYDGVLNEDALRNMDQASKEAYAALKTAEILEKSAQDKKLALARNTLLFNSNLDRIKEHPNGPMAGFMGLLDRDIYNAKGDRVNVSSNEETVQGQIAHKMHIADEAYSSKAAGLKQDTTGIRNMVRELFGVKTGDGIASAAAKGWSNATDWSTKRASDLGKVFTVDDEWRMPQFWNAGRVEKFGQGKEFTADIAKHIESGAVKIFDKDTGKIANAEDRQRIVDESVRNIRKDLSKSAGPGSVFKDEMRVFRFQKGEAGAEAYLQMMDKYGSGQGGYFPAMQGHVQKMARELSMLELQGPNWRGNLDKLYDAAKLEAANRKVDAKPMTWSERIDPKFWGPKLLQGVGLDGEVAAKRLMQYMKGDLSGAESETVAGVMSGTRSLLTSMNMGSAFATAVPADTVNWTMAANHRGLNTGRLVASIVDILAADTPEKAAFATKLGIHAHAVSRAALGTKQFGDQMMGTGIPARMADFVIRVQGLHHWDTAIKRGFPMEFLAKLGDYAGKSFEQVDPAFKSFLTDYGFTKDEWNLMAQGEHLTAGPIKYLMPSSLPDALHTKIMSAINDEKQFAYLAGGSNRVRALTTGGAKAGTPGGEMARSFFLFKTFPVSMLATWGARAAQEASAGKLSTVAQLGLFMTMAGAVAVQAKNVLQGKDPEDMKTGWFWKEAALQGGALGLYGDFVKEATSRAGTSMTEAALGPTAMIPAAIGRLTSGAIRNMEYGEHVNFGAALADDIQRFTPGGNLWYTRLLTNRYIFDNIRRQIDPDYAHSFARMQERTQKAKGQGWYWAPGQSGPDRAPDMGAMFK